MMSSGFSENSLKVMARRYLRKDEQGAAIETPAELFQRVAEHVAQVEAEYDEDVTKAADTFYSLMAERRFFPNSPTFTGAGTPLGQLAACFVLPLADDLGKEDDGLLSTLRNAGLIQQTGGGNGFSFSRLRPRGDIVKASNGKASGPVSFLRGFDGIFGEVLQGGVRRGANMAVLRVDHPDIEEFIECKAQEGAISNFNISVALTDEFMHAVQNDDDFELRNPRDNSVWKTVRARELFDKIIKYAHHNGEPGALFIDAANRSNPVPHLYELEATNPCGEQWLGPYENCCLGSINLAQHVTNKGHVDWELLRLTVREATHFLDNVVDANAYVPAVPQLKEAAYRARRIGLGIMGLGDMMYQLGIRYGSEEGQEFAAQIVEFVRFHCMMTSIELAYKRGPFPAIEGSIYDSSMFNLAAQSWQPPKPLQPYARDWGRPEVDWNLVVGGIEQDGIRNAAQTTVAPTGTIAAVCGCEGYGCEPVFALGYVRHFDDDGKDAELHYTSPILVQHLADLCEDGVINGSERWHIIKQVEQHGNLGPYLDRPYLNHFVVSSDITPEEHIRMQASIQAFVDNSLSKTCNLPEGATEQDVADAYMLAWELGCKGLTVYVAGSREKVVLETRATKEAKSEAPQTPQKRQRPDRVHGATYRKDTPLGKAYVTVNSNGDGPQNPFEVFLNVGKAGSEVAAVSEALGRLISLILRLPSTVSANERARWIVDELTGIGGGRPLGFGPNRVRSLPDGIAQVLAEHLGKMVTVATDEPAALSGPAGDICPDCGEASVLNTEGCRKCHLCGYSEC